MAQTSPLEAVALRRIKKHLWSQPQQLELRFPGGFSAEVAAEASRVIESPYQTYRSLPAVSSGAAFVNVNGLAFRQIFEVVYRLRCVREALWIVADKRTGGYAELKSA